MRKKENTLPPTQRAAMSGFSKADSPARGQWAIDWIPRTGVPAVALRERKAHLWDPAFVGVEAHEGWHIAYTPNKGASEWLGEIREATGTPGIELDDLNAVEDGRINRIGLADLEDLSPTKHREVWDVLAEIQGPEVLKKRIADAHKTGNLRMAARLIVAGLPHTKELLYDSAWKRKRDMQDMVRNLRYEVQRAGLTVDGVARVCKHLTTIASAAPPPKPTPKAKREPEWTRPDIAGGERMPDKVVMPTPPPREGGTPWGKMTIIQPKLTDNVYDGADALSRPTAEPGTLPKYLHRWRPWEGSFDVFARKRRDQGKRARLSLLIDGSGSMTVTNHMIAAIQERLPAATVGIYGSEWREDGDHCRSGVLVIVAQSGKRLVFKDRYELTKKYRLGGGNVVDGPALRWLGKLAGPRVWVSDAHVTGVGDRSCGMLSREATSITKACGITRCADGDALFAWLDAHGFTKSAVKRLR